MGDQPVARTLYMQDSKQKKRIHVLQLNEPSIRSDNEIPSRFRPHGHRWETVPQDELLFIILHVVNTIESSKTEQDIKAILGFQHLLNNTLIRSIYYYHIFVVVNNDAK
jgi:hypothetical protein